MVFQKELLNLRKSESIMFNQRKSPNILKLRSSVDMMFTSKKNIGLKEILFSEKLPEILIAMQPLQGKFA